MERDDDIVIFGKYENPIDANIVKGVLESNGIIAGVVDDQYARGVLMSPSKVMVMRRDLDRARQVLHEINLEGQSQV